MNFLSARKEMAKLGLDLRRKDGEYRITFSRKVIADAGKRDALAYYTDDLKDAVGTGRVMASNLKLLDSLR